MNENLVETRNLRIRSICSQMENKKHEIVAKVGLALSENAQPSNLLARPVMNFLFGRQYVAFMDKAHHLQQSVEIAKYIKKNDLLPSIDKTLSEKYPHLPTVRRLVLAVNVSFNEGRQPNTPVNAGVRYRYKENERN